MNAGPSARRKTFSRRLDAATPVLNLLLLAISIGAAVILAFTTILPDIETKHELQEKVEIREKEVETERNEVLLLREKYKALDDPHYVARLAVTHYRFRWRNGRGHPEG